MGYLTVTHVNTQFGTPNDGATPATTGTSTVTKPTGLAVGDLMLAMGNANKAGISGVPTGFTLHGNSDATVNAYRNFVYYKIADSSDVAATNFVWTNTDTASPLWVCISAYRNVDPNNPIHASGAPVIQTTTEPQTTPTVTTTVPCLIVSSRTVRLSDSAPTNHPTTFSGTGTQRFTKGNYGAAVGYYGTSYDPGSNTAAGTITGFTISHTTGTLTDGVARTIALTANFTATPGVASCTAAALGPEMVNTATATASALGPLMVNTATATAAALNPPMFARASTGTTASALGPQFTNAATATAAGLGPMMVNKATASASALNPPMFARASTGTTAAAYGPTVISGGIAPAGVAQATAAAIVAPMITAQAIRAMATANSAASHLYFGSSRKIYVSNDVRVYYVPVEPRTLQVGRS